MELRGYGIDYTRLRFCGGDIGHKLQLIAIEGQYRLLVCRWIPRGDGCFTQGTEDQAAVERGYGEANALGALLAHQLHIQHFAIWQRTRTQDILMHGENSVK